MGHVYSYIYGKSTDVQQAVDSNPIKSSSASSVNGMDDLAHIQSKNITMDTQRTAFPSSISPNHIDEVARRNIYVCSAGKSEEFFIFPAEKISVLLQEACNWAGKKPEQMNLVFEGEKLDVMKAVSEYPSLRGGSKVNLIRAS